MAWSLLGARGGRGLERKRDSMIPTSALTLAGANSPRLAPCRTLRDLGLARTTARAGAALGEAAVAGAAVVVATAEPGVVGAELPVENIGLDVYRMGRRTGCGGAVVGTATAVAEVRAVADAVLWDMAAVARVLLAPTPAVADAAGCFIGACTGAGTGGGVF